MQLNGSQRQLNASDYLAEVSNQINGFVVGYPANKDKFCKHIGKVVREAEKYGQYLRDEWQKAKEAGLTQYKDKEGEQGWFWWIARTNDWMNGESVYFADDEKLDVQFYIEGETKPDPLYYLSCMIWVCVGREYEGLERLDYQFVLLAIIHDAQNLQAGGERIYFNPLEKGTLSDRLCLAAWRRLEKSCELPYRLRRDVQQIIKTAMCAVSANLEQEKGGQSKTNIPDYKALNLAKVPISRLIEQGESHTLEFKEIPECNTQQNRKNNDVLFPPLKTIAGFLNAEGGILLIGVDNSGKIVGIEPYLNTMEQGSNDTFEQQIRNCLRDRFEPYPIGKVKVSFEKFMEGMVCRIDVQADKEPVNLDNEVYVRDGNTTQLLKGRRLTDWIQQRRLLTALPSGK